VRHQAHPRDHSVPAPPLQDLPLTTVALVTFGCAKNLVDSEVMAGILGREGFRFVDRPEVADVVILNTCGFIAPARDETDEAITRALSAKRAGTTKRVIVAGCGVERNRSELAARFPEVDGWTGVKDFDKILAVVRGEPYRRAKRTFLYDDRTPRALSTPASWAYVKISEGCSHGCAFCTIPSIKGAYRSRSVRSIIEEVRRLRRSGVREINLVSQDTTFFGRDRGDAGRLPRLLQDLGRIRDLSWIRIPFQHADRNILRRMKRSMDGARALRLIDRLRERIPGLAVRTSLIVGFPGEGKREFAALKAFVRDAQFDHLGVFAYSREPGTSAWRLGDPVPESVKAGRRDELMAIQSEISARILRSCIGRTIDVLLEGASKDDPSILVGRTPFQAPEVDGLTFVTRAHPSSPLPSSPLVKVEITGSDIYDLEGFLLA
jgi:ribosomal protein S12 methylthiotransferase